MKQTSVVLVALITALASGQPSQKSLYERIGRYDTIASIVDEYLKGFRADPASARFSGRGADSLRRAKQLLKDQLCAMAGGPCVYIGRDMASAHEGLKITAAEWAVSQKYMAAALDANKISGAEKTEFLALIESLRPHILDTTQK